MIRRKTTEQFITEVVEMYKDEYDRIEKILTDELTG